MKLQYRIILGFLLFWSAALLQSCDKDSTSVAPPEAGKGGSLARFTIARSHLYVVDHTTLYTYSLANPQMPEKLRATDIGLNIETIYPWRDKLFIGSREAMYIYSIANPAEPSLLGSARHVRACDPVVANDSVAYVTVRTGSNCGGNRNAMFIYNIRNILDPSQVNVVNLENPHGLGIQDSTLFVCDEKAGLRVYDLMDPFYPKEIKRIAGEVFYDCIPMGDVLICMIEGGMAIYDISDRTRITLLSKITE
jgi:hypothetical protein